MDKYGVIFDMDGVIIDSEPVYKSINEKIFNHMGIKIDDEAILHEIMGVIKQRKWELLKERYNLKESIDTLIEIENKFFSQVELDFKKMLFPEVVSILQTLKLSGMSTALASSSDRKRVYSVLKQCKLECYFDKVITGDDVVNGKPNPEVFLTAAKEFELPPENCTVIEDSTNGLLAAKRAKMNTIGIKHQEIKMDLSLADRIVHSLGEITF
ncbi:HAD family hydrolase [Amphibacillus sp. Q70]|uniref:HAD family hydrolase n=1 Tax=Amphibacillus sp. Q70 TaxID=3453416 RepID=UPI003F83A9D1